MEVVIENVSYSYDTKKQILDEVSIELKEGKITSLVGKSGTGKTTIAELIDGLRLPTSGKIRVGDIEITNNSSNKELSKLRNTVGLVFQFPEEQFFNLTVYDEIAFGLKYFKYKNVDIKSRVIDSLRMVGLNESYLGLNPFTLSNGEMRKVAIASILILNPKVIIFDEPTIGLDANSKKSLIQLMRRLKQRYNKTILLISHDIDLVHSLTDYVYILDDKKVYLSGGKYDVFKEEEKLNKIGLSVPKVIEFSNMVKKKKGIKLGYRDNINDLIKDIYRHAK